MEQLQLDWSTAQVSDGDLTVELSGKPPKEWRSTFQRTAVLLGADRWKVDLDAKQRSVHVASVRAGDEDRVRQFLEGAVLEANATLVSEQELFENEPAEEDEHEPDSDEPERPNDEELTERFREFGGEQAEGDDEEAGRSA